MKNFTIANKQIAVFGVLTLLFAGCKETKQILMDDITISEYQNEFDAEGGVLTAEVSYNNIVTFFDYGESEENVYLSFNRDTLSTSWYIATITRTVPQVATIEIKSNNTKLPRAASIMLHSEKGNGWGKIDFLQTDK